MMEIEMEGRVKALNYKVKAMSRESPSQKASHVLETDLRAHWSTSTNTKEWILLELDEPCLLSHIRIYNKSVLEWEILAGLRYKPETFVKVRPRCEAPRRDMIYPANYIPCRYVRISCMRGNPIAIFFIQLIGVSVTGLEPEFQPVVNHLLPQIILHKQDDQDLHLQLLQDMTNRLLVFLPQLEPELTSFLDAPEQNLRFLAMLAGPFYPILCIVNERENARYLGNNTDSEAPKNILPSSSFTVSSNFEPRRSRNVYPSVSSTSSKIAFRPDAAFSLLRKAYKESDIGAVCRMASIILQRLAAPVLVQEPLTINGEDTSVLDNSSGPEFLNPVPSVDFSSLFGEEFQITDYHWDSSILNVLDTGAVEEGVLHVLYACASQPLLCRKLAENASEFWCALPLVQALLPALRPHVISLGDHFDDSFSSWKQPLVQQALSQIVATSCSPLYRPLLHACTCYLSSFSPSHAKAACVLIDLCSSVLEPWMAQATAKIDLTIELLEDLLGTIQCARHSLPRARAALKYIILALSGHMDDILGKYKEVKHKILFLLEMLEPFLDPAIEALKSTIAFGDVSPAFLEKQEQACLVALNVIHTAVQKPDVLPSLESEWRRGSVAPSVLLSIVEPHMQLPPDIDLCKSPVSENCDHEALSTFIYPSVFHHGEVSAKSKSQEEADGRVDVCESGSRMDFLEDASLLFVPAELQTLVLTNVSSSSKDNTSDSNRKDSHLEPKHGIRKHFTELFQNGLVLDTGLSAEYFNLQADYFQLVNHRDCELRASEFRRLASDLYSQNEITVEGHDAAIDALLLAAECYVNPFFMMSFRPSPKVMNLINTEIKTATVCEISEFSNFFKRNCHDLETVAVLENKRDKCVLQLLLEASELDRKFCRKMLSEEYSLYYPEETDEQVINLSPQDEQSTDAITLVRQNQALLCSFLIQRLKKEHQSMHEILMHCLGFLLHSATRLYCAPDEVIGIILQSAEYLNGMLTSFYYQFKEGNLQLDPEKIHGIQRRWILLQRLVIASSSGDGLDFAFSGDQFRCGNLIPPSIWIQKITTFSCSSYPLVRFLGWMAISRIARQYTKERQFLASDLSQLTYLLSIYGDELAVVDNVINQNSKDGKLEKSQAKQDSSICQGFELAGQQHTDQSFHVIYPDLRKFFPNLKRKFESFGDDILEAVGLQLRSLSSSLVPDILCWFSDFCSWPFSQNSQMSSQNGSYHLKGYVAKNAKAVILYILEAIVVEHMEAMVPEIPRLLQVLISLCGASYCDVSFLDSVMRLLKPIISYSLKKVVSEEKVLVDDSCLDFESVCFDDLFVYITQKNENQDTSAEKHCSRALVIFIVASIFADLSFQRKREILQSLALWADFTTFGPASSFHDYVSAFQNILDSCKILLVQTLKVFGVIPLQLPKSSDLNTGYLSDNNSEMNLCFLDDICHSSCSPKTSCKLDSNDVDGITRKEEGWCLSVEEIEGFCKDLENLIATLIPTIEQCWNLHHRLAKKLIITSTQCFMFSRCLSSIVPQVLNAELDSSEMSFSVKVIDQFPAHWRIALEGLAEIIMKLLEIHCWEVTSMMLNCLLGVPYCFRLDNVIDAICSVIKSYSSSAPKIAWRFRSDKWLSILLARGVHGLPESDGPLTDLFISMLGHPEPEQRLIALRHLGRLVGQDTGGEPVLHTSSVCNKLLSSGLVLSVPESSLSLLVPSTWDQVVLLASSDALLPIRTRAMALLLGYIPYAAQHQLQSFLAAADSILHVLGKSSHPACEGPLLRLSLALIAGACLYSPEGAISLISQDVWRNIEAIGLSRTGKLGDMEKSTCEVLCSLRDGGVEAKEVLRKVLSTSSSKQVDADFGSTRESILQVLANITSVRSYFDMFSKIVDQKAMELEEAEIQLEILQNEQAVQESSKGSLEEMQIPWITSSEKDDNRLLQIKDLVHSLDKSKLREDIVSRRQKKLLMRRARQKYLEEAALQEEELLRELDRERTAEAEKEIERQRLLELERARTRELRHNLDMEKERQTQRELQRELEQAESGLRSSRRDFSTSTHNSRPRERYRERENGRASNEGSARTSSGSLQPDASATSSSTAMGTVVLSNSRPFSGQPPTILQLRDRQDDCGSSYEETFDGSKDSGDTGSVGDLDVMLAFDGQSGGFGSTQRHGSRGSKSRQVLERREGRERDGRREGKWERKHS